LQDTSNSTAKRKLTRISNKVLNANRHKCKSLQENKKKKKLPIKRTVQEIENKGLTELNYFLIIQKKYKTTRRQMSYYYNYYGNEFIVANGWTLQLKFLFLIYTLCD